MCVGLDRSKYFYYYKAVGAAAAGAAEAAALFSLLIKYSYGYLPVTAFCVTCARSRVSVLPVASYGSFKAHANNSFDWRSS